MEKVKSIIADIKIEHINLILILCVIVYLLSIRRSEHMAAVAPESLDNLASIYNGDTMTVNNINVTGKITTNDFQTVNGTVTNNLAVTKQINCSDGVYGKYFALNGDETDVSGIGKDGIFYRTSGQAAIYTDDHLYVYGGSSLIDIYPPSGGVVVKGKTLQLDRMAPYNSIAGYMVDGEGSTIFLEEGRHSLVNDKYTQNYAFMNDSLDTIYLYKGWKVTVWRDEFSGTSWTITNTDEAIKAWQGFDANQVTAYEAIWVGY